MKSTQYRLAALAIALLALGVAPAPAPALEDGPPRLLELVEPVYPPRALEEKIEGTVLLKVKIEEDGNVFKVRVLEGVDGCPEMDEAAAEALRASSFAPAVKNGKAVVGVVVVPVQFALE